MNKTNPPTIEDLSRLFRDAWRNVYCNNYEAFYGLPEVIMNELSQIEMQLFTAMISNEE
jgi:hypothetical protein